MNVSITSETKVSLKILIAFVTLALGGFMWGLNLERKVVENTTKIEHINRVLIELKQSIKELDQKIDLLLLQSHSNDQ